MHDLNGFCMYDPKKRCFQQKLKHILQIIPPKRAFQIPTAGASRFFDRAATSSLIAFSLARLSFILLRAATLAANMAWLYSLALSNFSLAFEAWSRNFSTNDRFSSSDITVLLKRFLRTSVLVLLTSSSSISARTLYIALSVSASLEYSRSFAVSTILVATSDPGSTLPSACSSSGVNRRPLPLIARRLSRFVRILSFKSCCRIVVLPDAWTEKHYKFIFHTTSRMNKNRNYSMSEILMEMHEYEWSMLIFLNVLIPM